MRSSWKRLLWLSCTLQLCACSAFWQQRDEVTLRPAGARTLGAPQPVAPQAAKDLPFAWLSDAAYGNTDAGLDAKRQQSAGYEAYIDRGAAGEPIPARATGCRVSQRALFDSGWQVWPDFPNDGLRKKIEASHLRVEVWFKELPPTVAVAFGGTVFDNRNDWLANLRWFIPWHKDQYSDVVDLFGPAFVEEFHRRLGDPRWAFLRRVSLYATGHSLGGGLAQQFAYALPPDQLVPRVSDVYAFDPSPVTGFFRVRRDWRDINRQSLTVERIYERGEILALLRSLQSMVFAPSEAAPAIKGVRYSLMYPTNPIAGHSIKQLACKLDEVAAVPAPETAMR